MFVRSRRRIMVPTGSADAIPTTHLPVTVRKELPGNTPGLWTNREVRGVTLTLQADNGLDAA